MLNLHSVTCILASLSLVACSPIDREVEEKNVSRIAMGSCLHQDYAAPIWQAVLESDPDIWIWLGDNVYADSKDPKVFESAYATVKQHPDYAALLASSRILGTWDDHDFGKNNGGKEWEGKAVAQEALMDFLEEPRSSPRRKQEGVYASYVFGSGRNSVKVILLDLRSHRDDPAMQGGDIFGEEQRAWIQQELAQNEAALTVIGSGTQVIPEDHKYEMWAQFPEARRWFFEQLVENETGAVLFLSGDRHISEFSKLSVEGRGAPLYELTSSSMTHAWKDFPGEPNRHRVGEVFHENNFGLLEIDWESREVRVSVRDESGAPQREWTIPL